MSSSDYVLVLNADACLEKNYIEVLLEKIKKDKEIGAISGKLLRARFDHSVNSDEAVIEKTNIIDSLGLKGLRNRRFLNIGEEQTYTGNLKKDTEVFGMPAVALLFKREVLEEIKYNHEYFDEFTERWSHYTSWNGL